MGAPPAKSFFEQQQLARRNSAAMVGLFMLAVVAVVFAVDLVAAGLYVAIQGEMAVNAPQLSLGARLRQVPPSLYLWTSLGTAAVIFLVSTVNVSRLGTGGAAVAQMVGARAVPQGTRDALERRLLNVVEEMAIAAGVRVPAVYVMDDERGINAFAAGWDVSGAVVAVTRGALESLTRDELQAVIGHEFSHILNGDMRLNIRMLGVLAGIVFIGSIGEFLMRSTRDSREKGGYIMLAGLALFIIGYVGLFFARLIKAAVSREREFLADASSVQFTRNPDGIAGALDQIDLAASGALLTSRYAEDMSHMFFGQGIRMKLSGLFDTHPPVEERIRRASPRFDASSYRKTRPSPVPQEAAPAGGAAEAFGRSAAASPGAAMVAGMAAVGAAMSAQGRRDSDASAAWGRSAKQSAQMVGALDAEKVDYAARLLASIPAELREGVREPAGAAGAIVALLLAPVPAVMAQQLEAARAANAGALVEPARAAAARTRGLAPACHLPLIDLALPTMKAAPEAARQELVRALEAVVNADRRVSLHEFVVLTLVRTQLEPRPRGPGPAGRKLAELQAEAALVLILIAHAGQRPDAKGSREDAVKAAFAAGAAEIGLAAAAAPAPAALTLASAGQALEKLNALVPLQKALLVRALFAAATADGTIRVVEAELLRLVAGVIDCPLPPLLAQTELAA